jgi:phage RecT family recombinase
MVVVQSLKTPEFQKKITESLPPGLSADRFTRMTLTAIQTKPELLEADKDSLYLAILASAQTGIPPDGKKAALVVFNTKVKTAQGDKWVKKVQFMPMVSGIIDKLGEVGVACDTEVVYENDAFEYEAGDAPKIFHKPAKLGTDRGMMLGAYAILRAKGVTIREVMDSKQIEQVRAKSKSPDSLGWKEFTSEMWRKTVLRRGAKRIPMPLEDEDKVRPIIDADDETFNFGDTPSAEPVDKTVVAEQKPAQQPAPVDTSTFGDLPGKPRAQLEQTKGETLEQPAPKVAEPVKQKLAEQGAKPANFDPPKKSTKPHAHASEPAPAPQARPRGLSAALAVQSDSEDVF